MGGGEGLVDGVEDGIWGGGGKKLQILMQCKHSEIKKVNLNIIHNKNAASLDSRSRGAEILQAKRFESIIVLFLLEYL